MKFIKLLVCFLAIICFNSGYTQQPQEVLVTINDSIYNVADFERLYTKNINIIADDSQKDIDTYFELYKTYKLKLQDAYQMELDQTDAFKHEFQTHRKDLAEKYFIDEEKLDSLLEEALERSDYEIKASHILFAVNEFASPADSLKAFNKAMEVRRELENGLAFEKAALEYSDDLSVKNNKGNLGYFGVFRMVYPFESAAYQTDKGEVSLPVRSSFGYHLIKVQDKRPTQNLKTIAHILVETKDENDDQAKKRIDNVYARIKLGERFSDAVLHFSDDESTRDKNGVIGIYREGTIAIDGISDAVYALNEKGTFSRPFFSQHGWHIVTVTDIQEKPSKDDLRAEFLRRIKSDSRSKILENDLIIHLKEQYHFQQNNQNIKEAATLILREELINQPEVERNEQTGIVLATFENQEITAKEVLEHIYAFPKKYAFIKTEEEVFANAFNGYALNKLKQQYDNDLEKNFPDFAQTMQEYKEGMLLFEWLEQKIWQPAANDTIARKEYYEQHKANYSQPAFFIGEVYVFKKRYDAKLYQKLLSSKYQLNEDDFSIVYKYQGRFYLDDKRLPENIDLDKIGDKVLKHNKNYYTFLVRDKRQKEVATYDEVQNNVLSDYQKHLEEAYTARLMENAQISVDEVVLEQLKTKYNKKSLN